MPAPRAGVSARHSVARCRRHSWTKTRRARYSARLTPCSLDGNHRRRGAGPQGRAVATDGGYVVNGTWKFASGAKHATWLGGHCKVHEADGRPRLGADGVHVLRTALFPRDRVAIADDWYVMGLRGTRSEGYTVDDLFVESRLTLDRETLEECKLDSTLYKFPTTNVYASAFSGVALGIARAMLDDLVDLSGAKSQRGARTSMRESAVIHTRLAELEAQAWRRARLPARDDPRGLGRSRRYPRAHDVPARPHPACDDPCHQPGDQGLGAGLPPRRLHRNFRGPCFRAAVPRCVRGLPAGPGAPHQLRDDSCSASRSTRSSCSRVRAPRVRSATGDCRAANARPQKPHPTSTRSSCDCRYNAPARATLAHVLGAGRNSPPAVIAQAPANVTDSRSERTNR